MVSSRIKSYIRFILLSIFVLPLFASLVHASNSSELQSTTRKVIYGDDDRQEPYLYGDPAMQTVSTSVAAMIDQEAITIGVTNPTPTQPPSDPSRRWGRSPQSLPIRTSATITLGGTTLAERGICATERFAQQKSVANCSGFLVGDDILVTAGHCITDAESCHKYKWVFGFQMVKDKNGAEVLADISSDNVYSCKEIMGRALQKEGNKDFSVIRLDRKVTGRTPLKLNLKGQPQVNDDIVVIGYPTGIPLKIAGGAQVKKLDDNFFFSNLDTYGGNSGSPVINQKTYEVEGILVRGNRDYVGAPTGGCAVSATLPNDFDQPEQVSFIGQTFKTLGIQ